MCLLAFSCLKLFCLTALISFQSSLLGTMRTVRDKILCPTPYKTLMVLLFTDVTLKDYQISSFHKNVSQIFWGAGFEDRVFVWDFHLSGSQSCCVHIWLQCCRMEKSAHVCVSAVSGKHHLNLLCAHSSSDCGCRLQVMRFQQLPEEERWLCMRYTVLVLETGRE